MKNPAVFLALIALLGIGIFSITSFSSDNGQQSANVLTAGDMAKMKTARSAEVLSDEKADLAVPPAPIEESVQKAFTETPSREAVSVAVETKQAPTVAAQIQNAVSSLFAKAPVVAQDVPVKSDTEQTATVSGSMRQLILNAANGDPKVLEQYVKKHGLPKDMSANGQLPSQTTITGTIEILHVDDFKDETKDTFDYYVVTKDQKKYHLYTRDQAMLQPGMTVSATGYAFTRDMIARAHILGIAQLRERPVEHKIAFVLVNFQDTSNPPYTPQQLHDMIFNGAFENFYEEQSYGRIKFTGDMYGWYTLPQNSTDAPYGCDVPGNQFAGFVSGVDFSRYDHVVFVKNCGPGAPGSGGGYSSVGATYSLGLGTVPTAIVSYSSLQASSSNFTTYSRDNVGQQLTDFEDVLIHEMGHALGVFHSNSLFCDSGVLSGNCMHVEYGNPFDLMGSGIGLGKQFMAFAKNILGWLRPSEKIVITQSGTYYLSALEGNTGVKYAEIDIPGRTYPKYYLEYRLPTGFDSTLSDPQAGGAAGGLFVYKSQHTANAISMANGSLIYFENARLLDVDQTIPSTNSWDGLRTGAVLHYFVPHHSVVSNFTDPDTNLSISFNNLSPTAIGFSVTMGTPRGCTYAAPYINSYYTNQFQYPVQQTNTKVFGIVFSAFNQNSSACGPTSYVVSFDSPIFPQPETFTLGDLLSDDSFNVGVNSAPFSSSISGNQNVTVTITDTTSGLSSSQTYSVYIAP